MKKYLLFAAVLGVIAFTSVSYLAQAEPETGKVETVIEKAAATEAGVAVDAPVATDITAPQADAFAADVADCEASVNAGSNGQQMDPEIYQNTVISCMTAKGYSAEDVKAPQAEEPATEVAPQDNLDEGTTQE